MCFKKSRHWHFISASTLIMAASLRAAEPAPPAATNVVEAPLLRLPQSQPYQQVLREYLATLAEKDFEHGVTNKLFVPPVNPDPEYQYRTFIMTLTQQPHVGGKRGIPAVNAPARNFLLSTIEAPGKIIVPPVWSEALATFIVWDSPGNVYRDNRALKMRAFVAAAVKLMMVDDHLDKNATAGLARADWNGYHLIGAGAPFQVFKDAIPAQARKAYQEGLLRLGRKLLAMGPKNEACDYEMGVAVGLWYAAQAVGDPVFTGEAEAYARKLCTDPRYFHPAGYWVERGGLDIGFGGMPEFWTTWLALASGWPFARETVDKAYRLKAHLILPEPDGTSTGPSAFNNRLGSPACDDQWHWDGAREHAAAMVTDEAVHMSRFPTPDELTNALAVRTQIFDSHLYGNLRNAPYKYPDGKRYDAKGKGRYLENDELRGHTWVWRVFPNGFNYPIEVNPGYDFYLPGAYAHIKKLQEQKSPFLKSPYLRGGTFVTNFGDAFVAIRQEAFAVIVHTGPVGSQDPNDGLVQYPGPMGFGGGQLSAFWTPQAGSLILGRRRGMSFDKSFDDPAQWRSWPIHAVSGVTADGKLFTSARIARPNVAFEIVKKLARMKVDGAIPPALPGMGQDLEGRIDYVRLFEIDAKAVMVETSISGYGKARAAELFETIPLFLDEGRRGKDVVPATVSVEFQTDGKWIAAPNGAATKVTAVRVKRRGGSMLMKFDTPHAVQLAPEWKDTFLTKATCRTVLVDLLGDAARPAPVPSVKLRYTIAPLP